MTFLEVAEGQKHEKRIRRVAFLPFVHFPCNNVQNNLISSAKVKVLNTNHYSSRARHNFKRCWLKKADVSSDILEVSFDCKGNRYTIIAFDGKK